MHIDLYLYIPLFIHTLTRAHTHTHTHTHTPPPQACLKYSTAHPGTILADAWRPDRLPRLAIEIMSGRKRAMECEIEVMGGRDREKEKRGSSSRFFALSHDML